MLSLTAKVNNTDLTEQDVKKYGKYIVARYDDHTHELWYYGIYATAEKALEAADAIGNGLILTAEVLDGV